MAYRRPKGIDEGEDVSNITRIPLKEMESALKDNEMFVFPGQLNALSMSAVGMNLIDAKNQCRAAKEKAVSENKGEIDALCENLQRLHLTEERLEAHTRSNYLGEHQDTQHTSDPASKDNYSNSFLTPDSSNKSDMIAFTLLPEPMSTCKDYFKEQRPDQTEQLQLTEMKYEMRRREWVCLRELSTEATDWQTEQKPDETAEQTSIPQQVAPQTPPNQMGYYYE